MSIKKWKTYPPPNPHYYEYKKHAWAVTSRKLNNTIMERLFMLIDEMSNRLSRFIAIRFDLHQGEYTDHNSYISTFFKNIKEDIKKNYRNTLISYLWVRERKKSEAPHYHAVIFLDASKIKTSDNIFPKIQLHWSNIGLKNSMAWLPTNPYYIVRRGEFTKLVELIYRVSYLAKKKWKENKPNIKYFHYSKVR